MTSTGHGIYDNQPTPGTDAVNAARAYAHDHPHTHGHSHTH